MTLFDSPEVEATTRVLPRRLRKARTRRMNRGRRGVSDVIATILLLALTVVLFSSIFAFVTSFPSPPAQNTSQFSASLVLTSNQSYVKGIQITHLAGPSILGTSDVWFKSATHPQAPEFQNPVLASTGLGGAVTWNLGQVFNFTFPALQQPILPDNITVYITTPDQLIFSTVLPGASVNVAPNFPNTYTLPAAPAVGAGFVIYATALGNLNGASVYVNLANVPGLAGAYPTPQKMTFISATDQWSFTVPGSLTTTNGTFFAFVNVTGALGQTATSAVDITVVSSSSGPTLALSIAVGLSTVPTMGSTTTFVGYVTYTGSASLATLNVTFYANRTTGAVGSYTAFLGYGPSGTTITGPTTVSVFSTTRWSVPTLPGSQSFTIKALVKVGGVGVATGSYLYTLPLGLGPGTLTATALHTCTLATTCPLVDSKVWENGTAFFGSGPFTVSASIYVNYTSNGTTAKSWSTSAATITVSPATLAPGAPSSLTPTTRWKPAIAGLAYEVTVVVYITGVGLVECVYLTTGTST